MAHGRPAPPRRPGSVAEPAFDVAAIARFEHQCREASEGWARFFRETGIEPFVVTYEDFAENYEAVIRRILAFLGVPGADDLPIVSTRLKKQSDATTDEWAAHYLELRGRDGGDDDAPAPMTIPDEWKRWIGENKLLKATDISIVNTLVRHGFRRTEASAEVRRAEASPYLQAGDWNSQRLQKTESLLGALRSLARLHPRYGTIDRHPGLSRSEFLEGYYAANRPVILEGLMDDWPARTLWGPGYFKEKLGDAEVEVMSGREAHADYEMNADRHRRKMRFADYVDLVYAGPSSNDHYLVANNHFFHHPGAKDLLRDIELFPEYLDPALIEAHTYFWFGPAGTLTPLHHDALNILFAQVLGRKQIKMIPALEIDLLYNDVGVYSKVDPNAPNLERWPKFRDATVIDVVLGPGEVLFIPVGWWHQVRPWTSARPSRRPASCFPTDSSGRCP